MVTVIGRFTFELNQGSLILTLVFDLTLVNSKL